MAGRGRGRGALQLAAASRRPGPQTEAKPNTDKKDASKDLEQIISQLRGLSVDIKKDQLKSLHESVSKYALSVERLESVCKFLYTRCQQDHKIAQVTATVADELASVEVDGRKFRSVILNFVQADFKNKEDLFENSPVKFLGIVSFLCQLFSIMKVAGKPMAALVTPIYEYLNMLVSSKSAENMVECFALQIASIGILIEEINSEKMTELMKCVRLRIINERSTEKSRCLLLEILEQQAQKWKSLPSDLVAFYGQILAGSDDKSKDESEKWD